VAHTTHHRRLVCRCALGEVSGTPRGALPTTETTKDLSCSNTVKTDDTMVEGSTCYGPFPSSIDLLSILAPVGESTPPARMNSPMGHATTARNNRCVCRRCNESPRRNRTKSLVGFYSIAGVMLVLNALGADNAVAFLPEFRQIYSRPLSYAKVESSSTTVETDEQLRLRLESMTVRELRDLLKTSPDLNKRGILSRLKLKKDIVDYLRQNLRSSLSENQAVSEKTTRQVALSMPTANGKLQTSLSARDATFERTYEQYPSLREVESCSGVGEDDIRQTYHPMFEGEQTQLTGDMDIVFVGTASCTPGVSRGVSCTALRLNWNRQALHGVPGAAEESVRGFNGGTWLFDAGECTQVRPCSRTLRHIATMRMRKIQMLAPV
jgi:hypothetical protein